MSRRTSQRVTIHDVARRAAVSRQTVSNALTHPTRVRPETLARVQAAIDELGYQPSSSAQSLQPQRAGAVGVELNTLGPRLAQRDDGAVPRLAGMRAARTARTSCPSARRRARRCSTATDEMRARRLVDAFVIADTHHGDPRPAWLEANGIPFASFGRVWDDPTFTGWVDVDGAAGTRAAVAHCAELGYRTVGYLGWPAGSVVGDDRRAGWDAGCAQAPAVAAAARTRRASRTWTPRGRPLAVSCATSAPVTPSCAPRTSWRSASTTSSSRAGRTPGVRRGRRRLRRLRDRRGCTT